jgi:hypothetical protein
MKLHSQTTDGPPCRHMEGMLQATADGSSRGLVRWYALAHASRCGQCNRFLHRLTETVEHLRDAKATEPSEEVIERLAAGTWRGEAPKA